VEASTLVNPAAEEHLAAREAVENHNNRWTNMRVCMTYGDFQETLKVLGLGKRAILNEIKTKHEC